MNYNNKRIKKENKKRVVEHFGFSSIIQILGLLIVLVVFWGIYKTGGFKIFFGKGKKGGSFAPRWTRRSKKLSFDDLDDF